MKNKFNLFLVCVLLTSMSSKAQLFEDRVYPSNPIHGGDMVLEDLIIGKYADTTDIISTGRYNYNQDSADATQRAVLVSNDFGSTGNFAKTYTVFDDSSNAYNTKSYSVAEYSTGYIMVGTVTDNSFHGSVATNGGDIILIKCNATGSVVSSKRIDLGGNDVAYAIKPLGTSNTSFVVCGNSASSSAKAHAFIMKIDNNLNVNWMTKLDLRSTATIPTYALLNDVVADDSTVWAVGSIRDSGTIALDGLVVKLNSNGTYLLSSHVYKSTDREQFNHVEIDGSNLVITGHSKLQKFTAKQRMIVLKYKISSSTVSNVYWLKSSGAGEIGYDIYPATISGNKHYYVVGETIPSSGASKGVFYELNSSFKAVGRKEYSGSNNKAIYALGVRNFGDTSFLSMAGYIDGIDTDGYILKTDLNGRTSCEDTLGVDTTALSLSIDTLMFSVDTSRTLYTPTVSVDTLLDSLICEDTTSHLKSLTAIVKSLSTSQFLSIFPNPVDQGENLIIMANRSLRIEDVIVYDLYGRKVPVTIQQSGEDRYSLDVSSLASGIYVVHARYMINGKDKPHVENFRVVIE